MFYTVDIYGYCYLCTSSCIEPSNRNKLVGIRVSNWSRMHLLYNHCKYCFLMKDSIQGVPQGTIIGPFMSLTILLSCQSGCFYSHSSFCRRRPINHLVTMESQISIFVNSSKYPNSNFAHLIHHVQLCKV